MEDLTFGEQVKIVLGRRGMTIKQLAELIEVKTGKKMSRQNLTQRLGRDNFQEQDMRMIAEILECPFRLSILSGEVQHQVKETAAAEVTGDVYQTAAEEAAEAERTVTAEQPAAVEAAETERTVTAEQPAAVEAAETERTVTAERPAEAEEMEAAEHSAEEQSADSEAAGNGSAEAEPEPAERDMTIGELYDIHQELTELEENVKAGESVEEIKKELEKPKRDWFRTGGLFLRGRRQREEQKRAEEQRREEEQRQAEERQKAEEQRRLESELEAEALKAAENETEAQAQVEAEPETDAQAQYEAEAEMAADVQYETEDDMEARAQFEAGAAYMQGEDQDESREEYTDSESVQSAHAGSDKDDFEPVIAHNDAEEDTAVGDVNPYTGREYQSNSVRMHPSRIGYVQVYDRTIHKWTDMTEWAFLGLQERKKALLGKAYEPPIYLD